MTGSRKLLLAVFASVFAVPKVLKRLRIFRMIYLLTAVQPYRFDRIYGGWWTPTLHQDAKRVLDSSAERYIQWLRGEAEED